MNQHYTPLNTPSMQPAQPSSKKVSGRGVFGVLALFLLAVGLGVSALLVSRQTNPSGVGANSTSTTVLVEVHAFVGSGTDSDGRYNGWFAVILDDGTPLIPWFETTGLFGPQAVEIPAGHTAKMHWDTQNNGTEEPYIIDPTLCTAEGIRATTTDYRDLHLAIPEEPRSAGRRSVEAFCGPLKISPTATVTPPIPTATPPIPTATPPIPTATPIPKCGDTCPVGSAGTMCPANHTCSAGGRCELSACSNSGVTCDVSKCSVITPTPKPPTPTPVPQCGAACTTDVSCPTNHSCSSGKCVLTKCLQTGVQCDATKCRELACIAPPAVAQLKIVCPNCSTQ